MTGFLRGSRCRSYRTRPVQVQFPHFQTEATTESTERRTAALKREPVIPPSLEDVRFIQSGLDTLWHGFCTDHGSDHVITKTNEKGKGNDIMKNIRIILVSASALVLLTGAANAFAQVVSTALPPGPQGIVDANGDGFCDITGRQLGIGPQDAQGQRGIRGNGPGDGAGNQGTRPKDGTGFGSQSGKRTGSQDGTQPQVRTGSRTGTQLPQAGARGRKGGRP